MAANATTASRVRTVCIVVFGLIAFLPPGFLSSQSPPSSEQQTGGDRSFSFSSDRTVVVFSEGREKTTLVGNAQVTSKNTQLSADYIEVYGEDFRFVECTGNVTVLDEEEGYRVKTDSLFFDRELEILRGRGANVMEDFDNEIVIKSEFLEHRNKEDRSEIQVGVRILGEDIVATAGFVRYQRDTEVLEFSGLPLVQWRGDQYQAARIIVDMNDDTVDLQGDVYGEIEVEDEAIPEAAPEDEAIPEDEAAPDLEATPAPEAIPEAAPEVEDEAIPEAEVEVEVDLEATPAPDPAPAPEAEAIPDLEATPAPDPEAAPAPAPDPTPEALAS